MAYYQVSIWGRWDRWSRLKKSLPRRRKIKRYDLHENCCDHIHVCIYIYILVFLIMCVCMYVCAKFLAFKFCSYIHFVFIYIFIFVLTNSLLLQLVNEMKDLYEQLQNIAIINNGEGIQNTNLNFFVSEIHYWNIMPWNIFDIFFCCLPLVIFNRTATANFLNDPMNFMVHIIWSIFLYKNAIYILQYNNEIIAICLCSITTNWIYKIVAFPFWCAVHLFGTLYKFLLVFILLNTNHDLYLYKDLSIPLNFSYLKF